MKREREGGAVAGRRVDRDCYPAVSDALCLYAGMAYF